MKTALPYNQNNSPTLNDTDLKSQMKKINKTTKLKIVYFGFCVIEISIITFFLKKKAPQAIYLTFLFFFLLWGIR